MTTGLRTKVYHLPVLRTTRHMREFFSRAKTIKTVDLMAENVLRRNDIGLKLTTWEAAMAQAHDEEHDECVILFLQQAARRCDDLSKSERSRLERF